MEKMLKSPSMSRSAWGSVLVIAALAALAGAWLLERLGLHGTGMRPMSFVGAVVAVKLGLFAFWPQLSVKGKTLLNTVYGRPRPPQLALWNEHDPRLDVSLFSTNVPTFILNQDQRLIDFNPAFELVFGGSVTRGSHVSR